MTLTKHMCVGAAAAIAALADALTATAGPGFDDSYTGTVDLTTNSNTGLAGILINGVGQSFAGTLDAFSGSIELDGGMVDGGSFSVSVLEADNVTVNTYSASIVSGEGQVNPQAGQGFSIDGLTFQGAFTSSVFAGIDVSDWFDAQPLPGSFIQFAFNPNAQGVDPDSDVDIFVTVPLPAGGAMAFAGLAGLASVRRRTS